MAHPGYETATYKYARSAEKTYCFLFICKKQKSTTDQTPPSFVSTTTTVVHTLVAPNRESVGAPTVRRFFTPKTGPAPVTHEQRSKTRGVAARAQHSRTREGFAGVVRQRPPRNGNQSLVSGCDDTPARFLRHVTGGTRTPPLHPPPSASSCSAAACKGVRELGRRAAQGGAGRVPWPPERCGMPA